jgi:hypothetical protein
MTEKDTKKIWAAEFKAKKERWDKALAELKDLISREYQKYLAGTVDPRD